MTKFLQRLQWLIRRALARAGVALAVALPGAGHLLALTKLSRGAGEHAVNVWFPWAAYGLSPSPCRRAAPSAHTPARGGDRMNERCGECPLAAVN